MQDFQFATGKISAKDIQHIKNGTEIAAASPQETILNSKAYRRVDPPGVEELGRSSWNLLHSITAKYPKSPSDEQKLEMKQFLTIFSHVYPCNWCASDFEKFIKVKAPKLNSREEFGRWMCEAHNEVNAKLKKEQFNCDFWEKRWKDGWED